MKIKLNYRALFIGIFFISSYSVLFAQQSKQDSLWAVYQSNDYEDSIRFEALYGYIDLLPSVDSTIKYNNLLIEETQHLNSPFWNAKTLNISAWCYKTSEETDTAFLIYRKALNSAKQAKDKLLIARTHTQLGALFFNNTDLPDSIKFHYKASVQLFKQIKDYSSAIDLLFAIISVEQNYTKDFSVIMTYLEEVEDLILKYDLKQYKVKVFDVMADLNMKLKEYEIAIDYYQLMIDIYSANGNLPSVTSTQIYIGDCLIELHEYKKADSMLTVIWEDIEKYDDTKVNKLSLLNSSYYTARSLNYEVGNYEDAEKYGLKSLDYYTMYDYAMGIASVKTNLGECYIYMGYPKKGLKMAHEAYDYHKKHCPLTCLSVDAHTLFKYYQHYGVYDKALAYYEEYVSLKDSLSNKENQRTVLNQEYKFEYDKKVLADSLEFVKVQAVKDLEIEAQNEALTQQRIGLFSTGGGLLLLMALAYYIRKGKKRSDELLLNILPAEIAEELKEKGSAEARNFDLSTILFTDFKGFTQQSEKMSPTELVNELNHCFKAFDGIIEKHGVEKIKTIGDSYMAAGGLPVPTKDSVKNTVLAALEIQAFVIQRKIENDANNKPAFQMRVGINTGPVVAGIVGIKKFQYDVWGDTVNTASRMESSGEVGKVNVSKTTYDLLKGYSDFVFESRGKIEAKGKGEIEMYFVSRN